MKKRSYKFSVRKLLRKHWLRLKPFGKKAPSKAYAYPRIFSFEEGKNLG